MQLIEPDWPAPTSVRAFTTTRQGGFSGGAWSSLNLGFRSGDDPGDVEKNHQRLTSHLPSRPQWLQQVHGSNVVTHSGRVGQDLEADAIVSFSSGQVCAVQTADCLPVLFCNRSGNRVAAAHAGWRGLARGVLQTTVNAMRDEPQEILAWLGPAIGPDVYEVGDDVRQAFPAQQACFSAHGNRWLLDLYGVARHKLSELGISQIYGGAYCTYSDSERFFSYRRDGETGRMASLIWIESP